MNRRELEEQIIARAWQDNSFKEELINNPEAALEHEGISLPESIEVKVFEENANTLYIILPSKPNEELSDAELESVAGGGWGGDKTEQNCGSGDDDDDDGGGNVNISPGPSFPIPIRTR